MRAEDREDLARFLGKSTPDCVQEVRYDEEGTQGVKVSRGTSRIITLGLEGLDSTRHSDRM